MSGDRRKLHTNSSTFQNKARVNDGLLLGLPQLIQVQIRGDVELIQHTNHLLTTIALPDTDKEVVNNELQARCIFKKIHKKGKKCEDQ